MLIAKITNNKIETVSTVVGMFPNVSFPNGIPDEDYLINQGCTFVTTTLPHSSTQKLIQVEPYIEGGQVFNIIIQDKSLDEIQADTTLESTTVRRMRNILLLESDWTQIPDATTDKVAWLEYRQKLRDITNQDGFPYSVSWPISPTNQEIVL
jgi:hypothetical protein